MEAVFPFPGVGAAECWEVLTGLVAPASLACVVTCLHSGWWTTTEATTASGAEQAARGRCCGEIGVHVALRINELHEPPSALSSRRLCRAMSPLPLRILPQSPAGLTLPGSSEAPVFGRLSVKPQPPRPAHRNILGGEPSLVRALCLQRQAWTSPATVGLCRVEGPPLCLPTRGWAMRVPRSSVLFQSREQGVWAVEHAGLILEPGWPGSVTHQLSWRASAAASVNLLLT